MVNWKKIAAQQGYRCVLSLGQAILGADRMKMLDARFRFGRKIDLRHPKTLADKVSWLSLPWDGPAGNSMHRQMGSAGLCCLQGIGGDSDSGLRPGDDTGGGAGV